MKESKCYRLLKHYGNDHSETVVAVSHEKEKLVEALKLVNPKGFSHTWKVLSEDELEWAHHLEGNYFAITEVTYL
jgi:hypothetical protein